MPRDGQTSKVLGNLACNESRFPFKWRTRYPDAPSSGDYYNEPVVKLTDSQWWAIG